VEKEAWLVRVVCRGDTLMAGEGIKVGREPNVPMKAMSYFTSSEARHG